MPPSCASRSGRGTTSRATSASTATTRSRALAAFDDGVERRVDLGRVERPPLSEQRLARRLRRARPPPRAPPAPRRGARPRTRPAERRAPPAPAACARERRRARRTRICLIGNNRYERRRSSRSASASGSTAASSSSGRRPACCPTAWEERIDERFTIELAGGTVRAAIDGEPVVLESPLELESLPGALRVLLPVAQG